MAVSVEEMQDVVFDYLLDREEKEFRENRDIDIYIQDSISTEVYGKKPMPLNRLKRLYSQITKRRR